LYASGRLRGRGAREQEHHEQRAEEKKSAAPREEIRVAVLPEDSKLDENKLDENKPRKTPKVEYRKTRRWSVA
jgi:hypothetical protein